MSLFKAMRDDFAAIATEAKHVRVRRDALEALSRTLLPPSKAELFDDTHHFRSDDLEALASYVLALDAINFGGGVKQALVEEGVRLEGNSLYYTVSTALKKRYDKKPMSAVEMATLQQNEVAAIMGFGQTPVAGWLVFQFASALRSFGDDTINRHNGRFLGWVDAARGSASDFVEDLGNTIHFKDVSPYKGRQVRFFKRAQIAVMDLNLAFERSGAKKPFADSDHLTAFADTALPHTGRVLRVLEYSAALAGEIDAGRQLRRGSEEEVEIRACAAHVVAEIARLQKRTDPEVDHALWHMSHSPAFQPNAGMRPHLCRCISY